MKPQDIAKSGTESGHQRAFFAWLACARMHGFEGAHDWATWNDWKNPVPGDPVYPELELFHAIPNGGKRDKITAANLKAEGAKAGVLDTFLPVPKFGDRDGIMAYHGLYIEFKKPEHRTHKNGGMSDKQMDFARLVSEHGYYVAVAYTWKEAANIVMRYYGVDVRFDV